MGLHFPAMRVCLCYCLCKRVSIHMYVYDPMLMATAVREPFGVGKITHKQAHTYRMCKAKILHKTKSRVNASDRA